MSTMDDAKLFLQRCHERKFKHGDYYMDAAWVVRTYSYQTKNAFSLISYLKNKGCITVVSHSVGSPFPELIDITPKGIDWIENVTTPAAPVQNITVGNNYGSIGNGNSLTINNSFNFENFDKAVAQNAPQDPDVIKEIEKLRSALETIQKNGQPVQQGVLKQFTKLLQDNAWLTAPIADFLIHLAFLP